MTTIEELQGMTPLEQAKIIYAESMRIFVRRLEDFGQSTECIKDPTARRMAKRDEAEDIVMNTALPSAALIAQLLRMMSEADRLRFKAYQYEMMADHLEQAEREGEA